MKLEIEPFETLTGWTTDGSISAHQLNAHREYIADLKVASVVFKIPAGNQGKSIEKAVALSLTGYEVVVISAWSRNKRSNAYTAEADFSYKLSLATGQEWLMPIWESFTDTTFALEGLAATTKVKITALHNDEDYIILSALVAVKDEYPLDIFRGVKRGLDLAVGGVFGADGVSAGTASFAAGDEAVTITGARDYLDRYATLRFKDLTHTEDHHVERWDENTARFSSLFDGRKMINAMSGAAVTVIPEVAWGKEQEEIVLPGIALWGMTPEPVQRAQDLATIFDTWKPDGSVAARRDYMALKYPILVDCESRHYQMLAWLSQAVRWWLGGNTVWINGRKHGYDFTIAPVAVEAETGVEQLPKIQYTVEIEVREERAMRSRQADTEVINLDVEVN